MTELFIGVLYAAGAAGLLVIICALDAVIEHFHKERDGK